MKLLATLVALINLYKTETNVRRQIQVIKLSHFPLVFCLNTLLRVALIKTYLAAIDQFPTSSFSGFVCICRHCFLSFCLKNVNDELVLDSKRCKHIVALVVPVCILVYVKQIFSDLSNSPYFIHRNKAKFCMYWYNFNIWLSQYN